MRSLTRGLTAATALTLALGIAGAGEAIAQYYDYGRPLPPDGYYDAPVRRPPPPRGRPVGYNCEAVQYGISGAQPYSCPLPGARPLGARCFCDMPIASFSSPQTAAGHVVP